MTFTREIFSAPSQFISKYTSSFQIPSDFLGFLFFYIILQILVRTSIHLPQNVKKLKNPLKEAGLFYGQIVSIVHACLSNIMGIPLFLLVIWCWSKIGIDFNKTNKIQELQALYNSLSYFLVDSIASQIFSYADVPSRIHHSICIINLINTFYTGYGAAQSLAAIFLGEVSNPSLQTRNTLRRMGIDSGFLYQFLEKSFVVLFLFCRLFISIPFVWTLASCQNCPVILVFLTASICSLSMKWNIEIINKLWKKVRAIKTQDGATPLSPTLSVINSCVKQLVHDRVTRTCVGVYCFVIYYAVPLWLRLRMAG